MVEPSKTAESRLTPEQAEEFDKFVRDVPNPLAYLAGAYPWLPKALLRRGVENHEMLGMCWEALMEAAGLWRPTGGGTLRTYAARAMRNNLAGHLRKLDRWARGGPVDLARDVAAPPADETDEAAVAAVERAMRHLLPRHRQAMTLRFGFDGGGERTLKQVGRSMGISGERVRQIIVAATRAMRDRLTGAGCGA